MSKKITELTALSAPAATDLAVVVDMSGTPTTKKSTLAQLSTAITLAISQVTGLAADLATRALASLTLTAGAGLTGGGDLSTDRTFAVGAGTGITVNADDVAVNYGTTSTTACIGNDARLSDSRSPSGAAGGDLSGTYPNPAVAILPNDVTQAGDLLATAIAAPSTPAAGKARVYVDSTSKNIAVKDDAGVVKHGVKTKAAVANSFVTAIDDDGTVTVAQPTDANLSTSDITTNDASTSKHGFVVKATAPAANVLNVVGIANGETAYTNKTLFDGTNPAALGTAAPGTSLVAAHRDHVHALPLWTVISNTDTGAQNNWAPSGLLSNTLIEWNGASDIAPTGLAGGSAGQLVTIKNITTTKIATFAHASGSSSAANRFTNIVTGAATPVAPSGYITYQHDGTNWQLVAHEQGAPITPAYSGGNFTASGSMTWTVESADVVSYNSTLNGKLMTLAFVLDSTTVGGTLSQQLRIAIPGSFTVAKNTLWVLGYGADNGTVITGLIFCVAGEAYARVYKDNTLSNNWAASTNATTLRGAVILEVT